MTCGVRPTDADELPPAQARARLEQRRRLGLCAHRPAPPRLGDVRPAEVRMLRIPCHLPSAATPWGRTGRARRTTRPPWVAGPARPTPSGWRHDDHRYREYLTRCLTLIREAQDIPDPAPDPAQGAAYHLLLVQTDCASTWTCRPSASARVRGGGVARWVDALIGMGGPPERVAAPHRPPPPAAGPELDPEAGVGPDAGVEPDREDA
ncbi:hypothetical protein [Thermocatellispora tengchongensis]